MRIGIIGAMPEEVSQIVDNLTRKNSQIIGNRVFISGNLFGIETVVTFSRWGKVASSIAASNLITNFNVDKIISTGVAGSLSEDVNIGDVIIAKELYQYDVDGQPFFKKHQIPLTNETFFYSCPELLNKASTAASSFIKNISTIINKDILEEFNINNPQVLLGKIATGDQFVTSVEQVELIKKEMPDALAVEMEGAAIAQVCDDFNLPFVAIRTISDKADNSAVLDFSYFVNSVAKTYSFKIIKELYKLL